MRGVRLLRLVARARVCQGSESDQQRAGFAQAELAPWRKRRLRALVGSFSGARLRRLDQLYNFDLEQLGDDD